MGCFLRCFVSTLFVLDAVYLFIYVFIDLLDYYLFCFLFFFNLCETYPDSVHCIVLLIVVLFVVTAWATHFPPCGTINLILILI